jgi:thiamine biosynthesis protein ThiS
MLRPSFSSLPSVTTVSMSATIAITANGQRHEIPSGQTLDSFLESVGQKPKLVVVERNGHALTPSEARAAVLAHGDVLEIVRIVAGG